METFIVKNDEEGNRIDAYLTRKKEDVSRATIQRLIS